jgi:membrane-bound lytic murein transglycosylase C
MEKANFIIFLMISFSSPLCFSDANEDWTKMEAQMNRDYNAHEVSELKNWENTKCRILKNWSDGAMPEEKIFVKYFDDDLTRAVVDYEQGAVTIETLQVSSDTSLLKAKENIKNVLSTIVDSQYTSNSIIVKDEINKEVIDKLLTHLSVGPASQSESGIEREHYEVSFKFVPNFIMLRATKLRPSVEIWAKKYNLDPAFILAIIRQESSFNPNAISSAGAIGLMQIMPKFAGLEVMKAVTGKDVVPTYDLLVDSTQNIMFGTTYLQLLRDDYFKDIKDVEKRTFLMTASYNWGPHRIKTAIKKGKLNVLASSDEVFSRLQQIAPLETQEYMRKVKNYAEEFRGKN